MNILAVSSSPHIRGSQSTKGIMGDVVIALIPALCAGVLFFGFRALAMVTVSVITAILSETLWNMLLKKENTISDLSAVVTGVLIALIVPVNAPLWIPAVGSVFAIIICKQLFGGLGQNFINPALGARAFLLASWPVATTVFANPFAQLPIFKTPVMTDAITSATPLAMIKAEGTATALSSLIYGNVPGCIGETSVIAILIGAIYLVAKKVITLHAPLSYIISAGFFGWLMGYNGLFTGDFLFTICGGGIMFGGFFMLTDYVTTPASKKGMVLAGIIAGFVTVLIRVRGGYPEGVTYAILLVNVLTPLIDKHIFPRKYGKVK